MCQLLMSEISHRTRRKSNSVEILRGEDPDVADLDAQNAIFREVDHSFVRSAIEELPESDREVLLLRYFLDIPVVKMARILRALYGYDLVNEPYQRGPVKNSYWELQRRAAEAIREIDPSAAIVVEANLSAAPTAFRYLSPLALDNVIYEVHFYSPGDYTHQGVGNRPRHSKDRPLVWPGVSPEGRVWDREHMRRILKPVRDFQLRHRCRIYVGEFSAIAWAPGAEAWLRDAISIFEEYGWDWTYHAFREWSPWSVEHEGPDKNHMSSSSDNPRKRALLDGFTR